MRSKLRTHTQSHICIGSKSMMKMYDSAFTYGEFKKKTKLVIKIIKKHLFGTNIALYSHSIFSS